MGPLYRTPSMTPSMGPPLLYGTPSMGPSMGPIDGGYLRRQRHHPLGIFKELLILLFTHVQAG